jgi:hypothetical protein
MVPKHVGSDVRLFVYIRGAFVGVMNELFNSVKMHGISNVTIS